MQIIKKINNERSMSSLNDSIRDLPCYGVCIQSKYDKEGNFTIKGINSELFISNLSSSLLALNIHLFNERKLTEVDYYKISQTLSKINSMPSVILSSSQLSRQTLDELRSTMLNCRDYEFVLSHIFVASNDDFSKRNIRIGDMIYSGRPKSNTDYEFDRLTDYIKDGVPVLLDWQDNYEKRISRMIEMTNNSDKLIVLTKKPQTTRRVLNNTI